MSRILVVGSVNMDLAMTTDRLPALGETAAARGFACHPGGKGANQAVAAARLGAQVAMLGCVGDDAFGRELRAHLQAQGVDASRLRMADAPTGVASIAVCGGDNAILVAPGANHCLRPEHLGAEASAFAAADAVLVQLEIPLETAARAAELAERHGKPLLLNPAPAQALPPELLRRVVLLLPNEHELHAALGSPGEDWRELLARHPGRVLMTRGRDGAYFCEASGRLRHLPGHVVQAVDSTGAGDAFCGALAAFLPLGLEEAARRANAAAALSVTRPGAQSGMPSLAELDAFLSSLA
ncbi:ribokinase [Chromobacterium alticapitis]|uniref:Ribokinase n=1 Tax=Chromobacterium alticapitis TaxID=2073169 RepID=A0A2S5DK03_9NEIS|nr:ribokinase [Chromobacterium alticapitis]POZ63359.1 ribokinase [Chromobacterium alticapitis]